MLNAALIASYQDDHADIPPPLPPPARHIDKRQGADTSAVATARALPSAQPAPPFSFLPDSSNAGTRETMSSLSATATDRRSQQRAQAAGTRFRTDDMSYDNLLLLDEFNRARSGSGLTTRQMRTLQSVVVCIPANGSNGCNASTNQEIPSCSICMEDFVDGDRAIMLKNCTHVFHGKCAGPWFADHTCCPNCRDDVTGGRS